MLKILLKLLFPPKCIGCKKEGSVMCCSCYSNICYQPSIIKGVYLDRIYILCKQSTLLRKIVHHFKYRYKEELEIVVSTPYIMSFKHIIKKSNCIVVPIPLYFSRYISRGFNQSYIIANNIAKSTNIEKQCLLRRCKHTKSQIKLKRGERVQNLRNAFCMKKKLYNNNIIPILIDDITTTGATLESAAKVLKEEGYREVYAMVLSKGI